MKYTSLLFLFPLAWLSFSCDAERDTAGKNKLVSLDLIIQPGIRVGPVDAASSAERLRAALGAANVVERDIYLAEGEYQPGLLLFSGENRELEVALDENGNPVFVRIAQDNSPWKTKEGLAIGATLKEVEKINGRPFSFYGLGWDFGGLVSDWNGGRLSSNLIVALMSDKLDQMDENLLGDITISSDDERVEALNFRVGSMVITFQ
jgi:hypothetical protein